MPSYKILCSWLASYIIFIYIAIAPYNLVTGWLCSYTYVANTNYNPLNLCNINPVAAHYSYDFLTEILQIFITIKVASCNYIT